MSEIRKLWFPSLLQVSNNIKTNSWFNINKHINPNKSKGNRINTTTSYIKTFKYQIYPDQEQQIKLNSWFDSCIDIYNKTNQIIKSGEKVNYFELRSKLKDYLNKTCNKTDILKHTADYAIKHCVEMHKSAISNQKNKNRSLASKTFEIRDLLKEKRRKNLVLEPCNFSKKKNGFALSVLGEMKSDVKFNKVITRNSILQFDSLKKKYYIITPRNYNMILQKRKYEKCGIDIGVRTFLTCYNENETLEIGSNTYPVIDKYLNKFDKIKSDLDTNKIKQKNYNKVNLRIGDKMRNRIEDLHKKSAKYLLSNYEIINIGKVSTKSMVSNLKGNLYDITKRRLMTLQHYKFRMYLKLVAPKWNTKINEINEYKTSITCHNCKSEHKELGSNKIYECKNCGISLDRDINAAINIYNLAE
jgi:transposase